MEGQKITAGYGGTTITSDYFANGWLKDVEKGEDTIASYTYDSSGNRTRVDFGNGTYQTFDYDSDPRYRLASIDYAYGCDGDEDIEVRGTLDLTRDNAGNPLTWGNDDYKKTYTYDDNNRLATAALPGNSTASYTYDWVGNRLGTGFTYNAADQMTASPGKSYTYDDNGNMLTGTMAFSYSPTNLVTEAGSTAMAWDSMGNRVSFTTSVSATYQFVYDPSAGIPAVVEEVTPGGSVYYVREPSGALIARITGTGENQVTTYYHFDELGSTLFLTGLGGILTDKYTYDAWGNVTSWVGETQQPYQFVGQLGYYTHYQESGFKLMQLGLRLYDPEMGRFMQRDVAEDARNSYGYVRNVPTLLRDPSGLLIVEDVWRAVCICNALSKSIEMHLQSDKMAHCFFVCRAIQCLWPIGSYLGIPEWLIIGFHEKDIYDKAAYRLGQVCGAALPLPLGCERCCRGLTCLTRLPLDTPFPLWRRLWRKSKCDILCRLGMVKCPTMPY